ncbi:MAG: LysE family transporter [Candidatus Lindowbacteria bacterium]|nr:LysE family transporter [Candidatus Lindowbacteria bacterium]
MTNLVAIFFTSLVIGFSGAVMPGPLSTLTLKESLGRGKTAALWLATGHSFCELLMVGVLVSGLSQFMKGDPVLGAVGLIGGAMLVWMGAGALRQARPSLNSADNSVSVSGPHNLLVGGAAVTVANPYWFGWWLTAGLALTLSAAKAGAAGVAAFYLGHISADFLWLGAVGLLVGWRRDLFSGGIYHRIIQACGLFLVVFGLLFIGYGGTLVRSAVVR